MLVDRRRSAFPIDFLARVGIAWLIVSFLLLLVNWSAISTWRFPDQDDTMRLVQVRDLIVGQGWFDVTQYRTNAPAGGVAMHWSRLVDLPLALVIVVLTPVLGSTAAETAAMVIVPLITLALVMLLAARIAWRLLGDEETNFTALIVAVSVPVVAQLAPLRIDHHGWQLVFTLAAINGLMARSPVVGGRVIGVSLAVLMAISVEGLPFAVVFFAVLGLRWLRDRAERVWLTGAIQALALMSAALFLSTHGFGDLATYCDAISPVHLAIFGWGALALTVLARLEPMPLAMRLGGFATTAAGAAAVVGFAAPQCAVGGGFAALDPLVHDLWYIHIAEGRPVWEQNLDVALQYAIAPLIGLYASMSLASQSREWLRRFWGDYSIILAGAILISLFVARAGAASCLIAAPPLAWQVNRWLRAARNMERPTYRAAAMLGVACALMPALPLTVTQIFIPARASTQAPPQAQLKFSDCRVEASADQLRALAPGEIFVPLHTAPRILLVSDHTVIGTGHHRGSPGMRDVIEIAMGSSEEARKALAARGTLYVAICPSLIEGRNYASAAPDGFVADLVEGREPQWLEPVETAPDTSFRLWRIQSD